MGCTTSSETASGGSRVEAFCSSTRACSNPQPRRVLDTNVRALSLTLTLSNPLTETTEHQLADLIGQRSTPRGASSRAIGDGLRIIGVTRRPRMPPTAVPALTPLSGQSSVGNPTIHSGDPLQRSGRSSRRQSSVSTGTTSAPDALLTAQRLHRARMLYHVEGRWAPLDPCPPPERILTAADADPAVDLHDALRDMHWSLMQPQSDEEADADRRARAAEAFLLQADATAAENGDAIHESALLQNRLVATTPDPDRPSPTVAPPPTSDTHASSQSQRLCRSDNSSAGFTLQVAPSMASSMLGGGPVQSSIATTYDCVSQEPSVAWSM
jgi:hypothetical protein